MKALPDMPSATHHANGKGGLEAPLCRDGSIDCSVWRKVMAMDGDSLIVEE